MVGSSKIYPGEWVEVRSQEEILATLDERGCLENLPFMPEMLTYCGKKFKVYKRADKTCDTISGKYHSRRMKGTVHLENIRCEGEAHGGCDATCLLFWKEVWLKKIEDDKLPPYTDDIPQFPDNNEVSLPSNCSIDDLYRACRIVKASSVNDGEFFSCQATELLKASFPLAWWDFRQYWRKLESGNVDLKELGSLLFIGFLNWLVGLRGVGRIFYIITGYRRYPFMDTKLMVKTKTPYKSLELIPGEIVQIKNIEEILKTLNWKGRNRGLYYDMNGEMLKYCNKKVKVLKRVRKVIDERTGKLTVLKNESVILEGVICCGHFSPNRLLCPRSLYAFWREIWLERVFPEAQTRMDV
jgi:hypothetical protein